MDQPQKQREKVGTKEVEINDKTKIPLYSVIACIISFVGGALWINNSLNRIENRLVMMENRVSDRWTGTDMRLWIMQLKMENPNLKIPSATQTGRE